MKKFVLVFFIGLISSFGFSQNSPTLDTLELNGVIQKLPKAHFAKNDCITESECFVLKTEKEEHILNTTHRFTLKLAQDNLNKKVQIRGIYRVRSGEESSNLKNCNSLILIPKKVVILNEE
jgi:hypothetical protein